MSDLLTLSAAAAWLGVANSGTNYTLLSAAAIRVDDIIAGICGRRAGGFLSSSHTELLDGNYADRFVLTYTPIIGTPAITIDSSTVATTLYTTEALTGIVGMDGTDYDMWFFGSQPRETAPYNFVDAPNFGNGFRNMSITYIGGYGSTYAIPDDLKQAALDMLGYLWNKRTRDTGLASKTLGDLSWTARDPGAWNQLLDEITSMYLTDHIRKAVLQT